MSDFGGLAEDGVVVVVVVDLASGLLEYACEMRLFKGVLVVDEVVRWWEEGSVVVVGSCGSDRRGWLLFMFVLVSSR